MRSWGDLSPKLSPKLFPKLSPKLSPKLCFRLNWWLCNKNFLNRLTFLFRHWWGREEIWDSRRNYKSLAWVAGLLLPKKIIKKKKIRKWQECLKLNEYQTDLYILELWHQITNVCLLISDFLLFLHVGNIKLFCTSKSQNKNNSVFLCRKPFQILVNFQKSTNNFMSNHG